MAEQYYDGSHGGASSQITLGTMLNIAGGLVSLALIAGVAYWGYSIISRDMNGVPVVQAVADPMRVAPENPGGTSADHQGLAVNQVAAQAQTTAPDQVTLAPKAIGLSADDVPTVTITANKDKESHFVKVEDAPLDIQSLADQLTAGATPLSGEVTGPKTVKVQSANVTAALQEALSTRATPVAEGVVGTVITASLRPKSRPSGITGVQVASTNPQIVNVPGTELSPSAVPAGSALAQLGAFDSAEIARAEWARISSKFPAFMGNRPRVVQEAQSGGRTFYRLRAAGFDGIDDARRFCAALTAGKADCIPVLSR